MVTAAVFAQKMDPFDYHVADFRLLTDKRVQVEVGLTKPQIAVMNKFADANRTKIRAYQDQVVRAGRDPSKIPDSDPTLLRYFSELRGQILSNLNPLQLRRLRELTIQNAGLSGILDTEIAKKVGISDDELKKARAIFEKGASASRKIQQDVYAQVTKPYVNVRPKSQAEATALSTKIREIFNGEMAKRSPEIQKLAAQTKKEFEAVVTPKQLAKYKALSGKKFVPK